MCELVNFPQTHGAVGSNSKTPNFESAERAFHPPGLIIAIVMELGSLGPHKNLGSLGVGIENKIL